MKSAFVLLALLSGSVMADDLSDANKLLEAREYARALPIFTKLAEAGNPTAQYHLGEMYWYGEGVPADSAKGDAWFRKADQAGYPAAKTALGLTPQRAARRAEIDGYALRYDGADVALAKFKCDTPEIPEFSRTAKEIKEVSEGIDAWLACYQGFQKNLEAQLPVGKAIPDDLTNLMTDAEISQVHTRMNTAYAAINAAGKSQATQVLSARTAWHEKTTDYVQNAAARSKGLVDERERTSQLAIQSRPLPIVKK
ncbi:hypothetical protein KW842_08125 [Duganella sp. sic0402]|uniref:tetratricopeptide repeat protein n=1 Tax=Duganella sp. sic0402 TaxID=2854786 RepID=UPI001C482528|nr:hypothetical protein [Duganella sp. sic0402]MBV7535729.1 hypothetical protein [Duganella sp. sic0402]